MQLGAIDDPGTARVSLLCTRCRRIVSNERSTPMPDRARSNEFLRARALHSDASLGQEVDLARVWRELVTGQCRVSDSFDSAERCYLLLEPRSRREASLPVQAGTIRILEAILLESAQKSVALELGLPPSTIASALKQCLEQLGLPGTASRLSPLLVGAAYASSNSLCWTGRMSQLPGVDLCYRVVSVARLETALACRLTPAQYDVVRLLFEGKSYAEIALARRRSTRTIANQLGAVFRMLGVSGRMELIRSLLARPHLAENPARGASAWASGTRLTVRRYAPRARRVLCAS
jgi:DNA-binding CsgD family transcriptional regulator